MKSFKEYLSYLLEDQEHWVTIRGRHILIGKDGKAVGGNITGMKLKGANFKTSKPIGNVGKLISKAHIMKNVSTIRVSDLPNLIKVIQKMNKKAVAYNLPEIKYEVIKGSEKQRKISSSDPTSFDRFESVVDIKVDGETPIIKGHKLVATLERMGNENIIRSVSDKHDLSHYRNEPLFCEHCGTARVKKNSIILENPEGKLIQVGKSCVKDYLETGALDVYLKNLESLNDKIFEFADEESRGRERGSRNEYNLSVQQMVAAAIHLINKGGYISKTKSAETGARATSDIIVHAINSRRAEDKIKPTEEEEKEAEKIIEWAKTQKGSDYLNNLRIIANNGFGNYRHAGYIASMPTAYKKAMDAIKPQEPGKEKKISQHVGQIGERIQSEVTVISNREYESDYGVSHVVKMEDKDGNVFITFTTGGLSDASVGETFRVAGTVKNHSDYKGVNQTQLTRCTIK